MDYNFKEIEEKYQKSWYENKIYEPDLDNASSPFYNLMMFPYPSAEGLHVGNMYAFVGTDIYGRYQRMLGKDVFEPIGLDGFGIHSENYAIKVGTHPIEQSKKSETHFYDQLKMIGNGFAWDERLETYKPEYYKWTQWVFKKMFDNGLAYRKKSPVNWCPSCKTVLADEQVVAGKCERCDSEIERKDLAQWFFRITNYADKLLEGLEKIDWSEKVKIAQKNWIGKSYGASVNFKIDEIDKELEVFTTRPDTLFGATYVVLAPEHNFVNKLIEKSENGKEVNDYVKKSINKTEQERREEEKDKTGVLIKGVKAINPVNEKPIDIYIADYVLSGYGTGAIMAVPAHDKRDWEFAKKHGIEIIEVIKPKNGEGEELYEGDGLLVNSGDFNGMNSKEAGEKICEKVGGEMRTNYRLRDWLISRQRYWGPPIPIIYCDKCWEKLAEEEKNEMKEGVDYTEIENKKYVIHSVPEKDLPVELPYTENFRPTGTEKSPLATVSEFYETTCPKCNNKAKRETDVSDTFLDSAWYYFRYINKELTDRPFNKERNEKWLPIDMYIGGAEHSVLHLLYTRFVTKAFYDWDLIDFDEPITKFKAHGLLIKEGAKMSKSKGNIVNPDEYIEKYGADVLRTYLMFLAPFEEGGDFRDSGIKGITKFLNRVWNKFENINFIENDNYEKITHKTIKKVTEDIEELKYNTAISALMTMLNEIENEDITKETSNIFLKLLAPFTPHLTEELWQKIGNKNSIHISEWPKFDPKLIKEEDFNLIVQINGKLRDTIKTNKGISEEEAKELALKSDNVKKHLENKNIRKTIFVKDRLINFVI